MASDKLQQIYQVFLEQRSVTTDSRNVREGSLFFALKGENFDGNRYAEQAVQRGASLAVVDDPVFKGQMGFIVVEDVLRTLQQLAHLYRRSLKAKIIGVTGSNGKTTTKELILSILGVQFSCKATEGNLNNHIGVPLTLLSLPEDLDFAIIEMGANHPGEIGMLSEIADPDYGLITNVGKAHLEGFGSLEGVVMAKTELYRYLQKKGAKAFVNAHNELLMNAAGELDILCYGSEKCPVFGDVIRSNPALHLSCSFEGRVIEIKTNLVGAYNLENVIAASGIGYYFGMEPGEIKAGIEHYVPVNNRSQVIMTGTNSLIMDAYNANPSSMEAALKNFAEGNYENRVLILGEMLELGDQAADEHEKIVDLVERLGFDRVLLVGKYFRQTPVPGFHTFNTTDGLISFLKKDPLKGHTILIKGSRGNQLERVVKYL